MVILISLCLLLFQATKDGLMDPTTNAWPDVMDLWGDIVALVFNIIILLIFLGSSSSRPI